MKRKLIRRNKIKYTYKVGLLKGLQRVMGRIAERSGIPVSVLTGNRATTATPEELDRYAQSVRNMWGVK